MVDIGSNGEGWFSVVIEKIVRMNGSRVGLASVRIVRTDPTFPTSSSALLTRINAKNKHN